MLFIFDEMEHKFYDGVKVRSSISVNRRKIDAADNMCGDVANNLGK
jgi:hypothetical protein